MEESEGEEEEEAEDAPSFMSRYAIRVPASSFKVLGFGFLELAFGVKGLVRLVHDLVTRQSQAKNSGKPRWMLLSEDFAGKLSRVAAVRLILLLLLVSACVHASGHARTCVCVCALY